MEKEILIKQLIYRSNHRGCKETDIILGRFFNEKFSEFDDAGLDLYNQFISEDDMLIYDWVLGKVKEEEKYSELLLKIRKFHNI
jgi:antitoxin CptB